MLISEVMARGIHEAPQQTHGGLFRQRYGTDLRACAIGTLYLGLNPQMDRQGRLLTRKPYDVVARWLRKLVGVRRLALCPACDSKYKARFHITKMVLHLNDDHRWTREKIAEYLDDRIDATLAAKYRDVIPAIEHTNAAQHRKVTPSVEVEGRVHTPAMA